LHKGDQVAFFKERGNKLHSEETHLLGDLWGQTLAHLQCNCGQDTLSIARHHGATVTGIDISDTAIAFAKRLSSESVMPLIESGLVITHIAEYPYSNGWRSHESMIEAGGRRFTTPPGMPTLPIMFSVVAHKPAHWDGKIANL
jgi:hypothetical protein